MDTSTQVIAKHTSSARRAADAHGRREASDRGGDARGAASRSRSIARRHEVNANLVFSWRRLYEKRLLESTRARGTGAGEDRGGEHGQARVSAPCAGQNAAVER